MQNPYITLGISVNASVEEIRAAYHAHVKRCHPDTKQDAQEQQNAQDSLVQINLAYAEAMRRANTRTNGEFYVGNAFLLAEKLLKQGQLDSALRMLQKAPDRDAEWFALHGVILMRKGLAEAAHASFRTAVRMEPDNASYREQALDAAVQMRKQKTLRGRMSDWARNIVGRML